MMTKQYPIGLAIILVACSGAPEAPDRCAAPTGSYLVTMHERAGGTCGRMPEQVVIMGGEVDGDGDGDTSGCVNKSTYSETGCRLQVDTSCPDPTTGALVSLRGSLSWDASGGYATGVLGMRIQDYGGTCLSTYDATWERQ